ncbi:hypothetical protein [Bacillus manliponensis]|uniref:hypothetical protein n=1 Tax=Bacillus manliponensis TaxID=574376 RepID=UPI003519C983
MKIKLISILSSLALLFSFLVPSFSFAMEEPTSIESVEENNIVLDTDDLDSTELNDIDWNSIPIEKNEEVEEEPQIQPRILGLVARVVWIGGKQVIKWGSKTFKKAPKSKVTNALSTFKTATYKAGNHTFKLTKTDMKHMLERHHPEYWNGTVKGTQTFYNPNLSVNGVKDVAISVAKQNSKILAKKGTNSTFQVEGTVNGVRYVLGITKGHIRQLYPKN